MTLQALTLQPFWRQDCCAKCLAGACAKSWPYVLATKCWDKICVCVKVLLSGLTEEIATICVFTFEYGRLLHGKNLSSKFREACLRKRKKAFACASGMKVPQLTKSSQVQCFAH